MIRRTAKLFQRQLYSLLSSKCALASTLAAFFIIVISLLQFGEVVVEWSIDRYEAQFSIYRDNIGERSFEKHFTTELPIDAVYTWVNGSDPDLLRELAALKHAMRKDRESEDLASGGKNATSGTSGRPGGFYCPFDNCVPWKTLVVSSVGHINQTHEDLATWSSCMRTSVSFNRSVSPFTKEPVFYLRFKEEKDVSTCLEMGLVDEQGTPINCTRGFLTTDHSLIDGVPIPNFAIATWNGSDPRRNITKRDFHKALSKVLPPVLVSVEVVENRTAVVELKNGKLMDELKGETSSNFSVRMGESDIVLTLYRAYLVWTPFKYSKQYTENGIEGDIMSSNRFEDNEELKYSLRSLEKNAPWIRHVYIVTNGQIPHWLNLDNPRVRLVTHEEIFVNRSHLPTYSSPAIESHIHRIKGLSKWFLYLNDDVLLGEEIWPEDFYTRRNGQKVYLSWAVPYCSDGCPPNWINDKYCDNACNNSACEFDGDDCKNVTRRSSTYAQTTYTSATGEHCNTGCLNNWLGDRYCDASCFVHSCGFDSGDCGVDKFDQLYHVALQPHSMNHSIPLGVKAMYFNLTSVFGNGTTVTKATYTTSPIIRTAVVSQKHKVLTFTFAKNVSLSSAQVFLEGKNSTGNNTLHVKFTISVDTATAPKEPLLVDGLRVPAAMMSFPEFNDTSSQEFLEHVAMTIQNANKSINYWVTKRPPPSFSTAATTPTPTEEIPSINFTSVSDDVLPLSAKIKLATLTKEYEEGDWTVKGYSKHKYQILQPYLEQLREWAETRPTEENPPSESPSAIADDQTVANNSNSTKSPLVVEDLEETAGNADVTIPPTDSRGHPEVERADRVGRNTTDDKEIDPVSQTPDVVGGGQKSQDDPVPPGRKLLSIAEGEVPPWVSSEEYWLADEIRKAKEKQLRLEHDIQDALSNWESLYGSWNSRRHVARTFPWEREEYFPSDEVDRLYREEEPSLEHTPLKAKRHLLDTFANSLRYSNRLYNKVYGYVARKVPAHMPHMINKEVMLELKEKFSLDFANTSSHKLRSPYDLQFSFSYFYYLMSEPAKLEYGDLFKRYDTDDTGILSARELRTLLTHVEGSRHIDADAIDRFQWLLGNCSLNFTGVTPQPSEEEFQTLYDPSFPLVTHDFMLQCEPLLEKITKNKIKKKKKYKFEELSDSDIAFKMVNENISLIIDHLDDLRRDPKKFICINDNINHTSETAHLAKLYIRDYYESVLPHPSQFELPPMYRNRFLHINQLREWQRSQQVKERVLLALLILTLLSAFFALFWEQVLRLKRCFTRRLLAHFHRRRQNSN